MRALLTAFLAVALTAACSKSGTQAEPKAAAETVAAEKAPIIPRAVLFGNAERASARISPDGSMLSWVAPDEGVMNVWVAPVGDIAAARALTQDRGRGIYSYAWAYDGTKLVYVQDRGGDENFRAYSVNVSTGAEVDLTPLDGVRAQLLAQAWEQPGVMLIGINDRDPRWHDVYTVNLASGERTLVYENTASIGSYWIDDALKIRLGMRSNPDGSATILKFVDGDWQDFYVIPYEDNWNSTVLGVDGSGSAVHALDSSGRDKAALVRVDLETGDRTVVGASEQADVSGILRHPVTREIEAYSVNYLQVEWTTLSETVAADLTFLRGKLEGELNVVSRTQADDVWIVARSRANAPADYHLYNRTAKSVERLFSVRPKLEGYDLQPMQSMELKSRDGLTLVSYLTLPAGSDANGDGLPETPVPMVLMVHGGPWARDVYGYNSRHQWLANRGYAVLSVNFRSSTGFGKSFVTAGDNEWSKKMHDDLLDAVQWAVDKGVTTQDKVAIMGGSYGGYATLVGLTFTPEVFACGVDIVGMSNMKTTLDSIPPYWASFFEQLAKAVGDPRTEEGKAQLKALSPLYKADQIVRPLLIAQGANDPRVKQLESDQIVEAMAANKIPVTYLLFPDEGHGFRRPENQLASNSVIESFLSGCLGGSAEPIGSAFAGSSLTVPHGAEFSPGLSDALQGHEPAIKGN